MEFETMHTPTLFPPLQLPLPPPNPLPPPTSHAPLSLSSVLTSSGMSVTGHLGAVFRTVLETMRTLFVWIVGLILFYTPLGMGRLGESWTAWSPLQAVG